MRKEKEAAIKLRKEGKSYSQIQAVLNVPKSTLSYWLREVKLTDIAQKKITERTSRGTEALIQRNKNQTVLAKERAEIIREKAKREALDYGRDTLFIAGTALYWAEGYKRGANGSKWKCVDFTNSDPEMVQVMMVFFRKFCDVDESQFRVQLIAHPNVDMRAAVAYWSKLTGVAKTQFIKTCTALSVRSGQKRGNNLTYGTVHIRVYDVKLFFRIIGWIDGLKERFLKKDATCTGL
ncbi:MAG: helix-turn-helix domain-containing protein [Candidatus Moranbacteria bacterium]|nr:helix-turn-helix domain-containing protein [Candidatus Moranbacteria bacterium]